MFNVAEAALAVLEQVVIAGRGHLQNARHRPAVYASACDADVPPVHFFITCSTAVPERTMYAPEATASTLIAVCPLVVTPSATMRPV